MTESDSTNDTSTASESAHANLWKRPGGEQPFHRYCALLPSRIYSKVGSDAETDTGYKRRPEMQYCFGVARSTLRVTPLVVAISAALLLIDAELATNVVSLSDIIREVDVNVLNRWGLVDELLFGTLWVLLLVGLLRSAGLLNVEEALRAALVYFVLIVLFAGVIASLYVVTTNGQFDPHTQDGISANVLFDSGFLLMLLLGGMLVYDGMLRTENMFWKLHEKSPGIIEENDPEGYEGFRKRLTCALKHKCFEGPIEHSRWLSERADRFPLDKIKSVPTVYIFAVSFVGPFYLANQPTEPVHVVLGLVPAALDFVLVVVFFQFLVLIKYLNKLLRSHGPQVDPAEKSFTLQYRPLHPDGYAGFKEFGQLATRVNVLLVIGGVYVVFRLYIAGMGAYPGTEAEAAELLRWAFDYVGPVVTYVVAVLIWMYFSFWRLHKAMAEGKETTIRQISQSTEAGRLIGYRLFREAPVWPINTRIFLSLLSMDILPIIGALLVLFPGSIDVGWL